MNPVQQTVHVTGSTVPLLITESDVQAMVESPEQVMEDIRLRATEVGAVLEAIFQEPHDDPRWEIDQ